MVKRAIELVKSHVAVTTIVVGVVLWLFQTFATISAVAEKESSLRSYVDQKHSAVEQRLDDISSVLKRIDDRVYELHKQR
jgi:hypothetical protein